MPIRTIQTGFEAYESKFKPFEWDSKHSNANLMNGIRSIWIQIRPIQTEFKALECKVEPFEGDSKHSNANSNY